MARFILVLLLCIGGLSGGSRPLAATTIATELGKGSAFGSAYALLKLSDGTAPPGFVQYFPPRAGSPGPVLIYILPYNGLTWSDQAIDKLWASRTRSGGGYSYPDVAQPNYVPGFSGPVLYWVTPPDQLAGLAHPYLANGVGVLFLHERFYTGQSADAQRRNMRLVYDFLAEDPRVDRTRIGIYGKSWGGLEAVYGTLDAPPSMIPAATVAWSVPIDFEAFASWVATRLPTEVTADHLDAYDRFYDPYFRRLFASIGGGLGGGSDWSQYNGAYVLQKLRSPLLLFHDNWDAFFPYALTRRFVEGSEGKVDGFWFSHALPLDLDNANWSHVLDSGWEQVASSAFSQAYLMARMMEPSDPIAIEYAYPALNQFFVDLSRRYQGGENVRWAAARLEELCDPRVRMVESNNHVGTVSGAFFVATMLNATFGTQLTDATVRDFLLADRQQPGG